MNLQIKIKTGFREDEYYSIPANEAHKAYYLFLHPEQRGVFSNGVALLGKSIMGIEPDYHGTMGWNRGYKLQVDDYNELSKQGVDSKLRDVLYEAKSIASTGSSNLLNLSLADAAKNLK